ncbi:SUMF1/EgtB/PvdO family nonheme iron enzyme [Novipirellula sp.]|uniref:SUMF1/EgtB/PvdO family nonheme iron enzyme n=1 Tax=Novipirellula sp. TaxID=2795430 RepID=UPI003567C92A
MVHPVDATTRNEIAEKVEVEIPTVIPSVENPDSLESVEPTAGNKSLLQKAIAKEITGEYYEAGKLYSAAIRENLRLADAYLGRGRVLVKLGRYDEGILDYKRAVKLESIRNGDLIYVDPKSKVEFRFVLVLPGEYSVGYSEKQRIEVAKASDQLLFGHNASPAQKVQVTTGFFVLDREITVGQYEAIVESTASATLNEREPPTMSALDDHTESSIAEESMPQSSDTSVAKANVSWTEATAFCVAFQRRIGLEVRLPTEIEWECAARGQTERIYPWGVAVSDSEGIDTLQPSVDVTPSGIHGLAGGLSEWCMDSYENRLFDGSCTVVKYTPSLKRFETPKRQSVSPLVANILSRLPQKDMAASVEMSHKSVRGGSDQDTRFNQQFPVRRSRVASQQSPNVGFRPVLLLSFAR